jgi:hypothetical protein
MASLWVTAGRRLDLSCDMASIIFRCNLVGDGGKETGSVMLHMASIIFMASLPVGDEGKEAAFVM